MEEEILCKKWKEITCKSWREGTYAYTTFYVDGKEIKTISEHKNECGVEEFNNLPDNEEDAKVEDITGNTPYWLDEEMRRQEEVE